MRSLAILLTCHNRVESTLHCLKSLHEQKPVENVRSDVFLVDDGSSDGTAGKVAESFPAVNILKGSGDLYWAGGMRMAFAEAMRVGYDFYLWLNDDTYLYPTAIAQLIHTHDEIAEDGDERVIIVGSTQDPDSGQLSYGGVMRLEGFSRMRFSRVPPRYPPQHCDTINGNCVLIPSAVANMVGNLDPCFSHSMGDFDYGFRAAQLGCAIRVAPEFVGACRLNGGKGGWSDQALPFRRRWAALMSPKGLPPREYRVFLRRHAGAMWWLHWIWLYAKTLASCWR